MIENIWTKMLKILKVRIQRCGCNNCGRNMSRKYLSVCILGRYYEFFRFRGVCKDCDLPF